MRTNGNIARGRVLPGIGKFSDINTDKVMTVNLRHSLICGYVVYRVGFVCLFV